MELGRGAEAIIQKKDELVIKSRPKKSYRHPVLDQSLRKTRTKKEAKVLNDLKKIGVPAPTFLDVNPTEGTLQMEFIQGEKLRDVLDTDPKKATRVAEHLTKMHNHDIIHGDLTTSNMIERPDKEIVLIDFGLSYNSTRIEDKAVDLHLFKQALKSKHHTIEEKAWNAFLKGYQPIQRKEILQRLLVVEKRGRNKV